MNKKALLKVPASVDYQLAKPGTYTSQQTLILKVFRGPYLIFCCNLYHSSNMFLKGMELFQIRHLEKIKTQTLHFSFVKRNMLTKAFFSNYITFIIPYTVAVFSL